MGGIVGSPGQADLQTEEVKLSTGAVRRYQVAGLIVLC